MAFIFMSFNNTTYSKKQISSSWKLTFLQIGKEKIFLELFQNLVYNLNIKLNWTFNIDQHVMKIYNFKDIKRFCNNFIDIALKCGRSIE